HTQWRWRISLSCGASVTSNSVTLTLLSPPTATVSGDATICPGGSATVSAALTGTKPWSITWSDGVVQPGIRASPATRTVNPTTTTTYPVTAVSNSSPCTGGATTGSATVTLNTPPGITCPPVALSTDRGACVGTVNAFSPVLTGSPTPTVQYSVDG